MTRSHLYRLAAVAAFAVAVLNLVKGVMDDRMNHHGWLAAAGAFMGIGFLAQDKMTPGSRDQKEVRLIAVLCPLGAAMCFGWVLFRQAS